MVNLCRFVEPVENLRFFFIVGVAEMVIEKRHIESFDLVSIVTGGQVCQESGILLFNDTLVITRIPNS